MCVYVFVYEEKREPAVGHCLSGCACLCSGEHQKGFSWSAFLCFSLANHELTMPWLKSCHNTGLSKATDAGEVSPGGGQVGGCFLGT